MASIAVLGLPAAAHAAAHAAQPTAYRLIPNLRTLTPTGFVIQTVGSIRLLRFDNTIGNRSSGVMEIEPRAEDCDGNGDFEDDRTAYQRVYVDADGDRIFTRGVDTQFVVHEAGCFEFDIAHGHWHFKNVAEYDLVDPVTGDLVAVSVKVGSCLIDVGHPYPGIPGSPVSGYYSQCLADSIQGLSVGWADSYSADLDGQSIDITNVPDGVYCYVSTADPKNELIERNDLDNSASRRLQIDGTEVTTLPGSC